MMDKNYKLCLAKFTSMTIPNLITISRIMLIPCMVVFFYLPFNWHGICSALIFLFAAFSDWCDGYLARKWGQTSAFGEFLDPVADKLVVVVALVLICSTGHYFLIAIPSAIIIGREFTISALREWMSKLGKSKVLKVTLMGKIKTVLQMIAVCGLLISGRNEPYLISEIAYLLLYLAAILTIISMFTYLRFVWSAAKNNIQN